MRIIYLHQYFVTPDEYGATRSYWFAKKLVERGHNVTIITALSSASKRLPGNYTIDGIKVIYIGGRYNNLQTKFWKVFLFVNFFFKALFIALKQTKTDLIFATSTPLTVGAIALLCKKLKKIPFVFEVRDLWPEFPIQIGAISNPMLIWILRFLEKSIYVNANHIVALSPGMQSGILSTGISIKKISIIPNMSKPDLFYPRIKSIEILTKFGIDASKFNIIHFGAMGPANGLEYIIEAAVLLQNSDRNDICFIFAGYGAVENKLKALVQENELKNVLFTGKHNTYIISELVNCCDASIVSFRNLPVLTTNSPNKLFDSLSAGKPIIVNSGGWTKKLIEEYKCGITVMPDQPHDMANKLVLIRDNDTLLKQMSENARRLSIEVFDKDKLAEHFADMIEEQYMLLN